MKSSERKERNDTAAIRLLLFFSSSYSFARLFRFENKFGKGRKDFRAGVCFVFLSSFSVSVSKKINEAAGGGGRRGRKCTCVCNARIIMEGLQMSGEKPTTQEVNARANVELTC